jgi:cellulose synthase/poly-beta-1,6-N-acetylglucosamine synthase-like glycosyltransferase
MVPDRDLPTVSVLLITRDRRALLADALKSIEGLDYPREKLQVVVLEDTNDPRPPPGVVYIARPPDTRGFGFIRNITVQASTGEILAFTDDDCVVEREWLRELVTPLLDHPDVAGVAGAVLPRNASLLGLCEYVLGYPGGGLRYIHAAAGNLMATRQLNTVNCAYRRRALLEAGGFDPRAARGGEDYLLAREVTKRHRCLFNPRAIVYHHSRGSLRGLFRRFFNFGRGEMEIRGFAREKVPLLGLMLRGSVGLKYLGLLLFLLLADLSPLWVLPAAAAHYACLLVSYRPLTRALPGRAVLWAVPGIRLVCDLGMDCGRAQALLERILGGART